MGRLALAHRGRAKVLPPLEILEPLIERTSNPPFHWYWLDSFYDDNLDRSAEFVWTPPAEGKTRFMVPRLLWQLVNPEATGRLLLENTCGLFTCINPAHWRRRVNPIRIPARIVLPDTVEAVPIAHYNALVSVHIRRNDAENSVCGVIGINCTTLKKSAPITCDECITTWVRTEQPFTEVK